MISINDLYSVLTAVIPLYVAMFLAYASVKWWNIFSPAQCAGINRFVAIFAVPLLSFEFISRINPYKMDLRFIAADAVSKILVLLALFSWAKFSDRGTIDWVITGFSVSTLPNTLVMGIPLLKSMYGDEKESIMIQAVVLQCIIWYTLMLFLFEYREATILVLKNESVKGSGNVGNNSGRSGRNFGDDDDDEEEEEMTNVILSTPSSNNPPMIQSVVPMVVEEDSMMKKKEVRQDIWRCGCCKSPGVCEQSATQACRREDEAKSSRDKRGETIEKALHIERPKIPSTVSPGLFHKIFRVVWLKLVRNPNSYASLLGLSWALASCRWNIKKPQILENSVTILSNAGLGMAMFSLGLFMALQPKIIACGKRLASYGMLARFIVGPALMAVASIAVGLRGTILRVSIVQAALPQGIVPFVFAREYNLHPDVLSTGVIFGMIISLPITILYYVLLGL